MEKFHGCMILLFAGKLSQLYSNLKHLIIKKKFAGKPSRLEANPRKLQKFSTTDDLHYTVFSMMRINAKVTLINGNAYSCHTLAVELV